MQESGLALISWGLMMACFLGGMRAQRTLKETHRSQHSVESIRLIITLLATFAAVVLGLVISSAQTRFSRLESGLRALSVDITELDNRLRDYGPDAGSIRTDLMIYTKAAIASTWPDEPAPDGDYPRHVRTISTGSLESLELGEILNKADIAIRRLAPQDQLHRSILEALQARMTSLIDQRWTLIENTPPSLRWPFLAVLFFWLAVIFVIAGLNSARNSLVLAVAFLASLSIASSVLLALELDSPLTGFIALSSEPMHDALGHLERPNMAAR